MSKKTPEKTAPVLLTAKELDTIRVWGTVMTNHDELSVSGRRVVTKIRKARLLLAKELVRSEL